MPPPLSISAASCFTKCNGSPGRLAVLLAEVWVLTDRSSAAGVLPVENGTKTRATLGGLFGNPTGRGACLLAAGVL